VLVRLDSATASTLWLTDLGRGTAVPLSTGGGRNSSPVWSPDGKRIVFASDREGHRAFYEKVVADTSPEHEIARFDERSAEPRGWLADGPSIVFDRVAPGTRWTSIACPRRAAGKLFRSSGHRRSNTAPGPLRTDAGWRTYLMKPGGLISSCNR